jgi:hypothetical protein
MKDDEMSAKPYVLVRTYSAGVHFGNLESRDGKEVTLSNARRLWYWRGAFTLNEIAQHGVGEGSKISETVSEIVLTEAIEVISTSQEGAESLQRFPTYKS